MRGLFRDAALEEVISATPCILRKTEIGEIRDKVPGWRRGAVFTREEAETLISDDRLPLDRRIFYAILVLAGVRHGEVAGLRWEHLDLGAEPLGRITVETSYDKGRTKTGVERLMPIHPTLASILAEWKLAGWESVMGRRPEPHDLVVPTPPPGKGKGRRTPAGEMRDKEFSYKRWCGENGDGGDLALLGLRHRRIHDMRRTFISLARSDGAAKDILRWGTHGRDGDIMDAYSEIEWQKLCAEVGKLKVTMSREARVVPLRARGR